MTRQCRRMMMAGLAAFLLSAGGALAGGSPESTLVLVNAESWASLSIANKYVQERGIPDNNVMLINGIESFEVMKVDDFRKHILGPVFSTLKKQNRLDKINCIAYSADFPYRIDISTDIGRRTLPKTVGKSASITGLTYLYQSVFTHNLDYLSSASNWYALRPFEYRFDPPMTADEQEQNAKVTAFYQEKHKRAATRKKEEREETAEEKQWERDELLKLKPVMQKLVEAHPKSVTLTYNYGCILALLGESEPAIGMLNKSVDAGWRDIGHMEEDDDLVSIRKRDDFKKVVKKIRSLPVYMPPARAFQSAVGWTSDRSPVPTYKGAQYMLSTMLAYTSGRGNSYEEACNYLARSVKADASMPGGTIYFMTNSNVRSRVREWGIPSAVERLKELGRKATIEKGTLPSKKKDVSGAFIGTASFNWEKSGSKILPGAICEHLTSCGGILREKASQTPLTAFLRNGAAGASGAVMEPYALQYKFPTPFLQVHYAEGCSLAEAFYQSVSGPYQLLIVGDPLCQPYAKFPSVSVTGITPGEVVTGLVKISYEPADGSVPIAGCHIFIDGNRLPAVLPAKGEFPLRTAQLPDGLHELRVLPIARNRVATVGRTVIPFYIGNLRKNFDLVSTDKTTYAYGETIRLKGKAEGDAKINILRYSAPVAQMDSGTGTAHIETVSLGLGEIYLRVLVTYDDGKTVFANPCKITVTPPPALTLKTGAMKGDLEEGFQLLVKIDGSKKVQVVERAEGKWLEDAGAKTGAQFVARAYFEVPAEGLYQFQFRGNLIDSLRLKIDNAIQTIPQGTRWHLLPVRLAKGRHRLTISSRSDTDKPRLDIRFGGAGARTLDGKIFKHAPKKD
ncbi:MAG: hypothetical protein KAI66_06850 [Lentisphaeria bacterium]|nr:hypothetical protein [Lentisphaeria bacterium]